MKLKSLLWVLLWLPAATGCALFEPRDAEPPGGVQNGRFIQPDRPEIVLENLQNAVSVLNVQNFLASLHTAFMYTPAQNNSTTDPDLWRNWGREQEQLWFNTIRSAATVQSGHQLQLGTPQMESLAPDRVRYTVSYSLTIFHNRTTSGIPAVATGSMILTLTMGENGLWAVTAWTDVGGAGGFSWSDLRSAFIRG